MKPLVQRLLKPIQHSADTAKKVDDFMKSALTVAKNQRVPKSPKVMLLLQPLHQPLSTKIINLTR
jgi:hypothetical protein